MNRITLGNTTGSKHLYEIETMIDGKVTTIDVYANTRTQANSLATKAGYDVRSVNMVG